VYHDAETVRSRCLFGPAVWSSSASSDDDRVRRKLCDAGHNRTSIRAPSASNNSDLHVTDPEIQTNADAETPSPRRASNISSTCQPETARSSITIIEGDGSATRCSGGSFANSLGWLTPEQKRSANIWRKGNPRTSATACASRFPKQSCRREWPQGMQVIVSVVGSPRNCRMRAAVSAPASAMSG